MKIFFIAVLMPCLAQAQSGVTRQQCDTSRDAAILKKCEKVIAEGDKLDEAKLAAAKLSEKNRKIASSGGWDE